MRHSDHPFSVEPASKITLMKVGSPTAKRLLEGPDHEWIK
jgi:hypothetical protein